MKKETLLKFPCQFPLKIMGLANDTFEKTVYSIILKHVPKLAENSLQQRTSKKGRYLSLTITIEATSQEQLDALYEELSHNKEVIMVL